MVKPDDADEVDRADMAEDVGNTHSIDVDVGYAGGGYGVDRNG